MIAANRALRIPAQLQLAEAHGQGIVEHQPADQCFAHAQNQLHGFGCLHQSDHARQNSQHSAFGAARHQARRWRFRIQASIARSARIREDRRLTFEAEDRSVNVRLLQQHAGVVHQIARREIIRAVDHHVVALAECRARSRWTASFVLLDLDVRIDVRIRSAAESSFLRPTSFVPWIIWRWRFVKSTTSKSTKPMRPIPAAARYSPSGAPSPPVPTSSTFALFSFN